MILVNEQPFDVVGARAESNPLVGLSTLLEQCLYRLPQCADVMIQKELQYMAKLFADVTGALLVTLDNPMITETDTYTITPATDAGIKVVYSVKSGANRVPYNSFTITEAAVPSITVSTASYIVDAAILRVTCSLTPHEACLEYPDWFIQQYGPAVISGTLARLMNMDGKPWTDKASAVGLSMTFHTGVLDAVVRRRHGGRAFTLKNKNPMAWLTAS